MKPCEAHWAALRKAIDDRGLTPLVSKDGEEGAARYQEVIDSLVANKEAPATAFDPLIQCYMEFVNRVLSNSSLSVLTEKDDEAYAVEARYDIPKNDGHYCPLCIVKIGFLLHLNSKDGRCGRDECPTVVKQGDEPWDAVWITKGADMVLVEARRLGLVTLQ